MYNRLDQTLSEDQGILTYVDLTTKTRQSKNQWKKKFQVVLTCGFNILRS